MIGAVNPCSGWHTVRVIEEVRQCFAGAGDCLGEALALIELADPADWRSPAASAYQEWVGDLGQRCRRGIALADESILQADSYRAMVINTLGMP
jgi:hypothetical protein